MAKPKRNRNEGSEPSEQESAMSEENQNAQNETTTSTVSASDERYIVITHPDSGQTVKRKDFIMECWQQKKMSRGAIAKKLSEIQGKKVPYQIVFAATKKVAGGPDKAPAETAAA